MKHATACRDYRREMILLALHRRLHDAALAPSEREVIEQDIRELEASMQME